MQSHFDLPLEHREWRPQLVGGIGGELALAAKGAVQAGNHLIKGLGQPSYLVIRQIHIEALAKVFGRYPPGQSGQAVYGREGPAGQEHAAYAGDAQRDRVGDGEDEEQRLKGFDQVFLRLTNLQHPCDKHSRDAIAPAYRERPHPHGLAINDDSSDDGRSLQRLVGGDRVDGVWSTSVASRRAGGRNDVASG